MFAALCFRMALVLPGCTSLLLPLLVMQISRGYVMFVAKVTLPEAGMEKVKKKTAARVHHIK